MAENKKSVIVYADWIDKFEELSEEEAGRLIKHFFRYVNDLDPVAPDRITKLMFVDIKNSLKRDLDKYKDIKKERSESGKLGNLKRYHKDLYDKVIAKELTLEDSLAVIETRKTSHSEKTVAKLAVSDSVSVNDINNNNYYNTCLKDSAWLEVTCMQKKHKPDTIKKYLETFKNHLIQTAEQKQNLREFKSHFTNWLNKQKIVEVVKKDWSNPYPEHRNN